MNFRDLEVGDNFQFRISGVVWVVKFKDKNVIHIQTLFGEIENKHFSPYLDKQIILI